MGEISKEKKVILCVDDQPEVLQTLRQQVETVIDNDTEVLICESGEEALEVAAEISGRKKVAVVISDQVMPGGMQGDELLINLHKLYPDTRKVMLTGQATPDDVGNVINNANLFRYLSKPWEAEDLKLTVKEALNSFEQKNTIEVQDSLLSRLHQATQIISMNVKYEALVTELLKHILEFAESDKVVLILNKNDELTLGGSISENDAIPILASADDMGTPYPVEFIQYVATQKTIQSIKEESAEPYKHTAYFTQNIIHTALGVPILSHGNLIGIFYLENKSPRMTYSPRRTEIINTLASNAAIAINNAFIYENMEELVRQKTDKIRAISKHKDEMVRIVSHDIRSPISGINTLAGMMEDHEMLADKDLVKRNFSIIKRSSHTVLRFVNDLLDKASLEEGEMKIKKQNIKLANFIRELADGFEPLIASKGLKLEIQTTDALEMTADSSKMSQAINNLLGNAIKFTPQGGIVIINSDEIRSDSNSFTRIRIADSGIGIPKAQIEQIFEKFNTLERSGTKGEKGTGLGLSIAKDIVELHNGTISIASDEGVGTTFTILIPKIANSVSV